MQICHVMHVTHGYSKHMGLCVSVIIARKQIDSWATRTKLGQCAEVHLSFVTMEVWARVVFGQIYSCPCSWNVHKKPLIFRV
jgi:hypothetical protein